MAPFKKYGTCMMTFFIHLCHTLSQFYPITSPVFFTKNNELWNERKIFFFVFMAASAYHSISKDEENCIFRHYRMYVYTTHNDKVVK